MPDYAYGMAYCVDIPCVNVHIFQYYISQFMSYIRHCSREINKYTHKHFNF
jgi:hypothetical protein